MTNLRFFFHIIYVGLNMIPLGYSASLTFVLPCFNTSLLAYLRNLSLCSVIVEALKVDSLQKLCSSLEPILRRVVS